MNGQLALRLPVVYPGVVAFDMEAWLGKVWDQPGWGRVFFFMGFQAGFSSFFHRPVHHHGGSFSSKVVESVKGAWHGGT